MPVEVRLIGNEGFSISTPSCRIFIDAFYSIDRWFGSNASAQTGEVDRADLILVTHAHWDHFDARKVIEAATRTGATVIGPASVAKQLRGNIRSQSLVEMEPDRAPENGAPLCQTAKLPMAVVTALRTFHSSDHNSYLVELPGFRFFHDGDNENTRRIDAAGLGRLDALFIGTWLGSGWVEFIETLAGAPWFIMHMSDEELDQLDAGSFFTEICDRVPPALITLRPGQSHVFEGKE